MATMSKVLVDKVLQPLKCDGLVHPWTTHCGLAVVDMVFCGIRGSCKYFAIIYVLQLMLRGRNITRPYLINHLKGFLQSICCGSMTGGLWLASSCFLRAILGRYYVYTAVFLPAVMSAAVTVHLERPVRRDLYAYTFFQATLEYLVRHLEQSGIGPMSPGGETIAFMIFNAALLYLLKSSKSERVSYWFFRPPFANAIEKNDEDNVVIEEQRYCPHLEPCWHYIMKSVLQYTSAGVGIQFLRAVVTKNKHFLSSPWQTFRSVVWNRNLFQLGAFLGVYIGIFKFISCLLCRHNKCDADWYAGVGGFISGFAYYIHPERTFALSAATSTLQLLLSRGIKQRILPDIPHSAEITFALCCGVLFHARFLDTDNCPKIITNIISTVTNRRSDYIYRMYSNRVKEFISLLQM